jgi:ElaA protein
MWQLKQYHDMSRDELYDILALRQSVFVVEQHCAYLDADGRDAHSWHLTGRGATGDLTAYLRIVAPGHRFAEPSIGRVIIHPTLRGTGLGKGLMYEGIRQCRRLFPGQPIRISAQQYLERFYAELGFQTKREGNPYAEDGIPHIEMVLDDPGPP